MEKIAEQHAARLSHVTVGGTSSALPALYARCLQLGRSGRRRNHLGLSNDDSTRLQNHPVLVVQHNKADRH